MWNIVLETEIHDPEKTYPVPVFAMKKSFDSPFRIKEKLWNY